MNRFIVLFGLTLAVLAVPATADEADCADPQSISEMNTCAVVDLDAVEAELKAVLKKAAAAAPKPKDLANNQIDWAASREAECSENALDLSQGGSAATAMIMGCKTERTAQRIRDLKKQYGLE